MSNLNEQQFAEHEPHRVTPVHAEGHSLIPVAKPDFDSPTHVEVTNVPGLQKAVGKKTAKRYDFDSDQWKSAKVDHYLLSHGGKEVAKIPVGYQFPEGFDPLR